MDPISTLQPQDPNRVAPPSAFSAMSSEAFMQVIFAELSNQDPLKPNDSSKLVQDLANVRSIQSDIDLSDKLKTLVTENQLASAGNMIGAYISGLTADRHRVEGLVVSITRTTDGPVLNLSNGFTVPLRFVNEVTDPRLLAPPEEPPENPPTNNPPTTPPRTPIAELPENSPRRPDTTVNPVVPLGTPVP
jgi:flagellar basal-body rod modification protein FlgD